MRHHNSLRKFTMTSAHRRAMFRNLATSLFRLERIHTTLPRAKDLRRVAEKLITLARKNSLSARRQAYGYLMDKSIVHKLFVDIAPRFKTRPGGYTRVIKAGRRHGDAAEMAYIELLSEARPAVPVTSEKKASQKAPKKAKAEKSASSDANEGSDTAPKARAAKKSAEGKEKAPAKKTSARSKKKADSE